MSDAKFANGRAKIRISLGPDGKARRRQRAG
jgi:hypothetical protein